MNLMWLFDTTFIAGLVNEIFYALKKAREIKDTTLNAISEALITV